MSLGRSVPHDSAVTHVSGRSTYIDDRPRVDGELLVEVIGAPIASGRVIKVHADEALKVPGIVGVYSAKDVVHNAWGTIVKEQPVLAERIGHRDEPVAIIAGETKEALRAAKKLVKIECEATKPILTIDEAIRASSYLYEPAPFVRGDVDAALKRAPHKIKKELYLDGQEHFYLESQACVAYPLERDQIEIHSSTQHTTETQHVVAHALGVPYHQVSCICLRMGGAFGGKESQAAPFAAMAALVAKKTGRAARLVLTKDDDMKMTGKRHPFKATAELGFDGDGRILAFKCDLYSDAGAYVDLSPSILDRALFHLDGAYYIEHLKFAAKACRTNNQSHTAFRGFGGPQGNWVLENLIEEMARALKKDALEIRKLNCYQGDKLETPYGQKLEHNVLPELFADLEKSSEYHSRRKEIDAFNARRVGKIRGLSMTGVKFGISFTARFLNQANALVNVHRDGTVQVSTGATEMGQGVNTKIQQTVATAFGIPAEDVRVLATSTERNANTSPTAASSGADLNCAAADQACREILKRLSAVAWQHFEGKPSDGVVEYTVDDIVSGELWYGDGEIRSPKHGKKIAFADLVVLAYLNRVSVCSYAHFKTPDLGFDKSQQRGRAFNYFTNGVCASEVEFDVFTGELKVRRVDLLMDIGRPMNPAIDMGQITGGFVQGMGWLTTEKLFYRDGELLSHSPTTYKIPNVQDTPRVFNVRIHPNDTNDRNFARAKAVGEPPLLLGISVWTAVQDALSQARRGRDFTLAAPATPEAILKALHEL